MTLAFPSVIAVTWSWARFLGQANTAPPGSVQNWQDVRLELPVALSALSLGKVKKKTPYDSPEPQSQMCRLVNCVRTCQLREAAKIFFVDQII